MVPQFRINQHMSPQNLIDKIAFKPYLKSSGLKKKGEKWFLK